MTTASLSSTKHLLCVHFTKLIHFIFAGMITFPFYDVSLSLTQGHS
jgi:hypothetical protein